MKQSISILFLFLLYIGAQAESEVVVTDDYKKIQTLIKENVKNYSQDELLMVFDLDDTVLINLDCPERNRKLKGLPKFEDQVRKCGAELASPLVPKIINSLQKQEYSVMALTARGSRIVNGTLKQLQERLIVSEQNPEPKFIDFFTSPFYSEKQKSIAFEQPGESKMLNKNLVTKMGVGFVSGADKGLALQAFQKTIARHYDFDRIVFIDDNKRNIRQMKAAYEDSEDSVLIIHYTEHNH